MKRAKGNLAVLLAEVEDVRRETVDAIVRQDKDRQKVVRELKRQVAGWEELQEVEHSLGLDYLQEHFIM